MTDPRIEAAARELKRLFSESEQANDAMWLSCAKCVLDAADAAAYVHIVPIPIPAERMRSAQSTLLCWKSGSLAHEDAISMIVCAVADSATPPQDEVKA